MVPLLSFIFLFSLSLSLFSPKKGKTELLNKIIQSLIDSNDLTMIPNQTSMLESQSSKVRFFHYQKNAKEGKSTKKKENKTKAR